MRKWVVYTEAGGQDVVSIDTSGKSGVIEGLDRYQFNASLFIEGANVNRYKVINASLIVVDEDDKLKALKIKKAEIDAEKERKYKQLFSFNGTLFYPDERLANAIMTSIQYNDDSYSIDIKSAEKLSDGVSNKFVTMDKETALQFSASLLERQKAIWVYGCRTLKDQLNTLYNDQSKTVDDILNFDIYSGWPEV